jgi:hypothetical protein
MAATAKKIFPMFNADGTPITGAVYQYRDTATDLAIIATFTEINAGLYTVVAETGIYDIYKDGSKVTELSPCQHIDSNSIPRVAGTISYGTGSDGAYTLDGTQASVSGLFTKDSATHYTLLRDGYFTLLTVNTGITLAAAGYRIFANSGVGGAGTIDNSGAAGGNATSAVAQTKGLGGSATADATGGYLPGGGPGGAGGNGGDGSTAAVAGSVGGTIAGGYWNSAVGLAGKQGGHGGDNSGGATGGAATGTALPATSGSMRNSWNAVLARAFSASAVVAPVYNQTNGGSGGGSRGVGTGFGSGGGGAAAGNNGGQVVIIARVLTGTLTISANGGTGGNGGNGGNATGVGGGGGGGAAGNGGNGGGINIFYGLDTSTWTYSVAGGSPGTKGTKGTVVTGTLGTDGADGVSGIVGIKQSFVI